MLLKLHAKLTPGWALIQLNFDSRKEIVVSREWELFHEWALFTILWYVLTSKKRTTFNSTKDNKISQCTNLLFRGSTVVLQWNPSITDTIKNQHFVPYSEVSLTQRLPVYFRWAWFCVTELLSTTRLHFQSFLLLYAGREG